MSPSTLALLVSLFTHPDYNITGYMADGQNEGYCYAAVWTPLQYADYQVAVGPETREAACDLAMLEAIAVWEEMYIP